MFKTLSGLTDNAFWRVQHQITATAYLVRDDSCGSPLKLSPAGGLPPTEKQVSLHRG